MPNSSSKVHQIQQTQHWIDDLKHKLEESLGNAENMYIIDEQTLKHAVKRIVLRCNAFQQRLDNAYPNITSIHDTFTHSPSFKQLKCDPIKLNIKEKVNHSMRSIRCILKIIRVQLRRDMMIASSSATTTMKMNNEYFCSISFRGDTRYTQTRFTNQYSPTFKQSFSFTINYNHNDELKSTPIRIRLHKFPGSVIATTMVDMYRTLIESPSSSSWPTRMNLVMSPSGIGLMTIRMQIIDDAASQSIFPSSSPSHPRHIRDRVHMHSLFNIDKNTIVVAAVPSSKSYSHVIRLDNVFALILAPLKGPESLCVTISMDGEDSSTTLTTSTLTDTQHHPQCVVLRYHDHHHPRGLLVIRAIAVSGQQRVYGEISFDVRDLWECKHSIPIVVPIVNLRVHICGELSLKRPKCHRLIVHILDVHVDWLTTQRIPLKLYTELRMQNEKRVTRTIDVAASWNIYHKIDECFEIILRDTNTKNTTYDHATLVIKGIVDSGRSIEVSRFSIPLNWDPESTLSVQSIRKLKSETQSIHCTISVDIQCIHENKC